MFFIPFAGQKGIQRDIYESILDLDKKLRWVDRKDKEFRVLWEEREDLFEWRNWIMANMGWYAFDSKKTKEEKFLSLYEW